MASDDDFYDYSYDEDSDGEAMEEDGVEDNDEPKAQEPPLQCWAIEKEALSAAQQQDLSMVMNLFNIKQHHARALLIHYRWNMEIITDHLDRKGQDRMLTAAGVVLQKSSGVASGRSRRVTCGVCFDDFSPRDVSTMDCGHSFCNDCWTGYFVSSLDSGKKQIRCMALKCPAICDEAVVQHLLRREHPAAAERFLDFLLQSYVDDNTAVKWCPSVPHCGRAIRVAAGESEAPLCEVECLCGHSFCFRCAARAHSPCPCAMWERWEAKCLGEAENVKWLLANTKTCPKCLRPIVKEGGCNHVTCLQCGQSLCWLCGAATGQAHSWTSIAGHSCNRFTAEEKKKVSDAQRQLRRYEHYYKRYEAHDMSHKSERDKLGPAVAELVTRMESCDSLVLKHAAPYLADAHRSLLGCRQVLSRSFVFAYYMFDDEDDVRGTRPPLEDTVEKVLFENFQEELEGNVERLSKLLERTSMPKEGDQKEEELLDTTSKLPEEDRKPSEEELLLAKQALNLEQELLEAKQEALNLALAIERQCRNMYSCIQDELLPMLVEPMAITAFQKKGPSKALPA
ncbi:hypothetical protein EJB05_05595 [Eragrostis curvula]|uniref:RBR-type E3 ubiquitin transferase n=1 Tax=Eragrostis curvula TaxID=38414 RepID=A0A5J9WDX3_9POAL|nr:hypothetical protein EJB05_05595 [Eragrostis curvula]